MKNNLVRVSILVLGAAAAYAQSPSMVTANIPFDFAVRGVNLPAGRYSVDARTPGVVVFRSPDSRARAVVGSGAAQSLLPQKEGRLVFHRYGNQYFLSDIWIAGSDYGRHMPQSKQERDLAKRLTEPGEVVIAATR